MRAIQIADYGDADVLQLGEAEIPAPQEGEVRVRIAAIGVNPADWKWRAGLLTEVAQFTFPHILGYDFAGVVDAVGPGVIGFAAGDRVAGATSPFKQGAYAEYVAVPEGNLGRIPDGLDFPTAAALPTPALTGVQLIEEFLRPQPGDAVLVTGAVGGVGRFAVYAAKKMQARVIAAVRASQSDEATALGADDVIVLGVDQWNGAPFTAVADTVGGPEVAALCRHVSPEGTIGTVSTTPIDPAGLPSVPAFFAYHPHGDRLAELARAVAKGEIAVPVARRMPLVEAAKAQRLMEAGGQRGKIVLEP